MTGLGSVITRANQTKAAVTVNDLTRRFVYSGGTPMLAINPKASGIPCNPIDGGILWPILPGLDIHTGAYNERKMRFDVTTRTTSPLENITYLRRLFVEGEQDMGVRVLESLTKVEHVYGTSEEESFDLAFDYFAVLHPEIECSFGLEKVLTSTAPGQMSATHYQACPTCRLADLTSDECGQRIYRASERLDSAVLQALREELISANQATVNYATYQNDLTNADLEKRTRGEHGKPNRTWVDFVYLKMLHIKLDEKKPANSMDDLVTALKTAFTGKVSADPSEVLEVAQTEGGVTLSAEEAAEYQAYLNRKAAMAKARAAKTTKENEDGHQDT
jgi:hypothetical protein